MSCQAGIAAEQIVARPAAHPYESTPGAFQQLPASCFPLRTVLHDSRRIAEPLLECKVVRRADRCDGGKFQLGRQICFPSRVGVRRLGGVAGLARPKWGYHASTCWNAAGPCGRNQERRNWGFPSFPSDHTKSNSLRATWPSTRERDFDETPRRPPCAPLFSLPISVALFP